MSLRTQKKQQTRESIIDAAERLIAEKGFQSTTMEDVAGGAAVSVGTLYNYFGSKSALLVAAFEAETEVMLAAGAEVLASPPREALDGVGALVDAYAGVMMAVPEGLLLEVLRYGFGAPDLIDELAALDYRLMAQLAELIEHYRADQLIAETVSTEDAVFVVFSVLMTNLIMYVSLKEVTPELARSQLRRYLGVAFSGLEPRDTKE